MGDLPPTTPSSTPSSSASAIPKDSSLMSAILELSSRGTTCVNVIQPTSTVSSPCEIAFYAFQRSHKPGLTLCSNPKYLLLTEPMHELFLTAAVTEYDRIRALQILQGYCAMSPVPVLRRRLYFNGSPQHNRGFDPAFIAAQGPKARVWSMLNEQMIRQAYTVVLLYDIDQDQFPKPDTPVEERPVLDCDATPGTLLWTDLPDPAGSRPVNSRLITSIESEKGLCSLLESSSYKFTGESIEEVYRFIHEYVVIYITRILRIPEESQEEEYKGKPKINKTLPPFENLSLYDVENKWVMTISLQVLAASDLENMQKGTEELMKIKADLEGLFDLQIRDRHIFDTRVRA